MLSQMIDLSVELRKNFSNDHTNTARVWTASYLRNAGPAACLFNDVLSPRTRAVTKQTFLHLQFFAGAGVTSAANAFPRIYL